MDTNKESKDIREAFEKFKSDAKSANPEVRGRAFDALVDALVDATTTYTPIH